MDSDKIYTALNPCRPEEGNVELTPMEAYQHLLTFFNRAQARIAELETERLDVVNDAAFKAEERDSQRAAACSDAPDDGKPTEPLGGYAGSIL